MGIKEEPEMEEIKAKSEGKPNGDGGPGGNRGRRGKRGIGSLWGSMYFEDARYG